MKTSKHLQDPTFVSGIQRLLAGEATRSQLCEEMGISMSTLSKRIGYAGLTEAVRGTKQTSATQFQANPDNAKAYADALAYAKQNPHTPAANLHRMFPATNYQVLCRKLRQQRSTM